jgi:ubiquinone biosynthesis protein COQ4
MKNNLDLIKNFSKIGNNINRYSLISKKAYESVKDPEDGQHISELGDLTNLKSLKEIKEKMLLTEEGKLILEKKFRVTEDTLDFKNLVNYNRNLLGYKYFEYMTKNNFSPNKRPISKYVPDIDLSYISQRYKETHDFYHVLLNMESSLLDEISVKWFEAEHLKLSSSSLGGLFGGLTLSLKENFILYSKILPGIIHIARNSKFLLGIYFENRLHQDIEDLRRELNIDLSKIKRI